MPGSYVSFLQPQNSTVPTMFVTRSLNTSLNGVLHIPQPNNGARMCSVIRHNHPPKSINRSTSPDLSEFQNRKFNFFVSMSFPPVFTASPHPELFVVPFQSLRLPIFRALSHSHYVLDTDPATTSSWHSCSTSVSTRVRVRTSWRRADGSARLHGRGC